MMFIDVLSVSNFVCKFSFPTERPVFCPLWDYVLENLLSAHYGTELLKQSHHPCQTPDRRNTSAETAELS